MTAPLTISALANGVAPSATLTVAARAAELRAQGRDVIDLSVGEPDFEPPQAVREAVARAVATQPMRYTAVAGTPELREAVAQWLGAYHGRPFGKEQVLKLRTDHAIYMADSGRFNLVGLGDDQIDRFTAAVVEALGS